MIEEFESAQLAAADPAQIMTQRDFGEALTAIRERARLSIRQVARASGLPISTTGDYFAGRHLPMHTQAEQLEKLLRACGESDPLRLEQWLDALLRVRRQPGHRPVADAPYRGLARFEPGDARLFFGREDVADRLAKLAEAEASHHAEAGGLPLVLVGPSGSGKSSLLRAGLIPRLSQTAVIIEPTATPDKSLETQLAGLSAAESSSAAFIVDQFEAVFTDCQDEAQRRAFISRIGELASGCLVVLALRADFYEQALRYPELAQALQARQTVLGPMTVGQVRRAIAEPARVARLAVEDGLVELLLQDLAPQAARFGTDPDGMRDAYEPGALPLLSHAMLATWEHHRGGELTIADYVASGGIRNALVRTAEGAFGSLLPEEQQLAQRLFLRLVHVADDALPTRAAVRLSELRGWGGPAADTVLSRFVDERLITVDADVARITHDALLVAWPRLRSWIDTGTENLRAQRRIGEAARDWQDAAREPAALWRGSQLAIAREWAADQDKRASLSPLSAEFVTAAVEAEQARIRAARRQTRRLQRLVAALTVLVVAVFSVAAYAFHQRSVAGVARDDANSREAAIEANQLRSQDAAVAAQLSVAAYHLAHTPQAAASVLQSTGSPSAARLVDSSGVVESVALSHDHRLLAVAAADGTLRLWNVAVPGHPVPLGPALMTASNDPLYTATFSPDGKILAAAGASRTISLWNLSNPIHPVRLGAPLTGPTNTVYSLRFSPDGKTLAAGSADNKVRLWNVSDPSRPLLLGGPLTGAQGYVESVAFSPDGTVIAAGSADNTVLLWNIASLAHPVPIGAPLTGPANIVTSVAFSPDGHMLAAASQDDKVWLWNVGPRGAVPAGALTDATDWVNTVAFSPDGTTLAAGTSDASVLIWSITSRSLTATLSQPQPVTSLAWDGASQLAAGDAEGTVSIWQVPPPVLLIGSPAYDAVFSPDGNTLAASSQNDLQLWNTANHRQIAAQAVPGTFVNAVAYSPRGNILAVTYGDGMFQLWSTKGSLSPLGEPQRASASGMTETVAYSPNGQLLVTGGDDGTIRLWSANDPAAPRLLATEHDSGTYVFGVAFSPSGKTVAAASADDHVRLWDVADPSRPISLGSPLRGPTSYALSVAFSPDGKLLAVGSADKTVRLWDVTNPRRPVRAGPPLAGPTGYIYGVAFSPDGHTLAASVTDGSVWLWAIGASGSSGVEATLSGLNAHEYSVTFSPSGNTIAAAGGDGTVRLWDTSPQDAETAVCSAAGQPLTAQEWTTYLPGIPYQQPCR